MLLQVAAGTRLREDTAALNMTYTASVTAVEIDTPSANHGSKCATFTLLFVLSCSVSGFPYDIARVRIVPGSRQTSCVADDQHTSTQAVSDFYSPKGAISTHINASDVQRIYLNESCVERGGDDSVAARTRLTAPDIGAPDESDGEDGAVRHWAIDSYCGAEGGGNVSRESMN
jgi:hypothetical protein